MNEPRHDDTLGALDGRSVLRMERPLPHPAAEVWAALTEPAALSRWFPFEVALDPRPGGALVFSAPGVGAPLSEGTVTAVDPPRLFAFVWGSDRFTWTVTPDPDGSVLALEQVFDDRAGAPSFAAGWHLCMEALARLLSGAPEAPARASGELHEAYVHRFGLDRGRAEAVPGGRRVRFERQLVRPAETVWEMLSAGVEPVPGLPVPEGFTAGSVPTGDALEVRAPHALTYEWQPDRPDLAVTWELRPGTGYGARLVLTQTGGEDFDTGRALEQWRLRIEGLARRLLSV